MVVEEVGYILGNLLVWWFLLGVWWIYAKVRKRTWNYKTPTIIAIVLIGISFVGGANILKIISLVLIIVGALILDMKYKKS